MHLARTRAARGRVHDPGPRRRRRRTPSPRRSGPRKRSATCGRSGSGRAIDRREPCADRPGTPLIPDRPRCDARPRPPRRVDATSSRAASRARPTRRSPPPASARPRSSRAGSPRPTSRRPCRCRAAARSSSSIRRSSGRRRPPRPSSARSGPPARTVPRRPDPGFLEIHQGEWQGLHRDEIAARYGEQLAGWRRRRSRPGHRAASHSPRSRHGSGRRWPSSSRGSARAGRPARIDRRRSPATATPSPDHPWSIVVGHDGVFKVALLTLFDLPLDRFWMWSMDLCGITRRRVPCRSPGPARPQPDGAPRGPDRREGRWPSSEERSRSGAL